MQWAGWSGRRFSIRRPTGEYLVVPTVSRRRETPMLLGSTEVAWVREQQWPSPAYSLRFAGPCNHLHALALVVYIGMRRRPSPPILIGR
jgi:hypothetical protein